MKIQLCCNIEKNQQVCFIIYTVENELYYIEEQHSEYAFFTTDEDIINATKLPIYTVKQFTKKYL